MDPGGGNGKGCGGQRGGGRLSLFAIGDTGKDREVFYAAKELDLPQQKIYKKLYFRNEKFCGGVLLGDVDMAPELVKAYEEKSAISELKL